jgi:hypothetical protein
MKKNFTFLKKLPILIVLLILTQSCQSYGTKTYTPEEAATKDKKVKVYFKKGYDYKFKKIFIKDEEVYGVTKRKSKSGKAFKKEIVNDDYKSKYVTIHLKKERIKRVNAISPAASFLGSTLIIVPLIYIVVKPLLAFRDFGG